MKPVWSTEARHLFSMKAKPYGGMLALMNMTVRPSFVYTLEGGCAFVHVVLLEDWNVLRINVPVDDATRETLEKRNAIWDAVQALHRMTQHPCIDYGVEIGTQRVRWTEETCTGEPPYWRQALACAVHEDCLESDDLGIACWEAGEGAMMGR